MELLKELVKLCDSLNKAGIRYAVVGGCAVILHGYYRTTHDIDLLIDPHPENIQKLKMALYERFGSQEVFEISDDDIMRYAVVRFAPESEEIVVDLLGKIGEISFAVISKDIEQVELEGITIPLCGLSALIETKRGERPKDKEDLLFLIGKKEYLEKQSKNSEP